MEKVNEPRINNTWNNHADVWQVRISQRGLLLWWMWYKTICRVKITIIRVLRKTIFSWRVQEYRRWQEAMTNDWSILNESCRYYLTEENCTEIKSALRLQELVKEEIVNRNHRGHKSVQTFKWSQLYARMLQSILNESQITPGVEGTQWSSSATSVISW